MTTQKRFVIKMNWIELENFIENPNYALANFFNPNSTRKQVKDNIENIFKWSLKLLISKSQILNSRETVQIGEERDEQKESQCVEMKSVESAETKNQGSK